MNVLDSDVCIDLLRGRALLAQVEVFEGDGPLAVTAVTLHELLEGAHRAPEPAKALPQVHTFLAAFDILAYDREAAELGGRLAGGLARAGASIGDLDTMIAATVLRHDGALVTRNMRHFSRVEGLRLRPLK